MKLYIKHMVSLRCKMVVRDELIKLGINDPIISLGLIEIREELTCKQREWLKSSLFRFGLELMDDKKTILIGKIRDVIMEAIDYAEDIQNMNYSDYISEKLKYDYTYLANIFSEANGITIQHFIIINKIEKVKKLLLCNQLNLSEISYKLHYSSVAHLSNQFKKITGLSPSFFKKLQKKSTFDLVPMDIIERNAVIA